MTDPDLEQRAINTIRGLAMDMPQAANSGHPGTAMALAPLAHVLWTRVMDYDASDPDWADRDRFVLSCGHASVLLYSMLHLTGYGLTLDDLKAFRQFESATPGHPEVHHTAGVEVTTGPLGQGVANGVGFGLAERWLRSRFGSDVTDHFTYVFCSDGDLEEGISHEAASLAGHLGLGRLVYVYDDNHISIDGPTELALTDDAPKRFEAYGWHVDDIGEKANDLDALEAALNRAKAVEEKPSLIVLRSHIGYPSPKFTDSPKAHGSPLGTDEITVTKEILGLPDEPFTIPDDVLAYYREAGTRGAEKRKRWEQRLADWQGDRAAYDACIIGGGLPGWKEKLPRWEPGEELATRKAAASCVNALADVVPGLLPGGADLTENCGVELKDHGVQSAEDPGGRLIHYGIREHAMGGIMNGMALHGGVVPVGGTFLTFSDYMRGSVRLAAISDAHVVYSWTHDSIGLGEDGPTHQPIEHVAALRAIPKLRVIRPADANETAAAYYHAIGHDGPTALVLTRQNVPVLEGTGDVDDLLKGAYALRPATDPDLVLVGTGSEVQLCLAAADLLTQEDGLTVQVVSMPCWELFDGQDEDYQESVIPSEAPTLSVEAGTTFGWAKWADASVGIDHFGASAPGAVAMEKFGFTAKNVATHARRLLDDLA